MKFTGSLAKPIIIETRSLTLLTSTPEKKAEVDKHNHEEFMRAITEQLGKIDELRNWLGLKEKSDDAVVNFILLSLSLAQKFVPGFRIKNKSLGKNRGRKKNGHGKNIASCWQMSNFSSVKKREAKVKPVLL